MIVGPGFVDHRWFRLFWGDQTSVVMKNGVNWGNGFAIGDS